MQIKTVSRVEVEGVVYDGKSASLLIETATIYKFSFEINCAASLGLNTEVNYR